MTATLAKNLYGILRLTQRSIRGSEEYGWAIDIDDGWFPRLGNCLTRVRRVRVQRCCPTRLRGCLSTGATEANTRSIRR